MILIAIMFGIVGTIAFLACLCCAFYCDRDNTKDFKHNTCPHY